MNNGKSRVNGQPLSLYDTEAERSIIATALLRETALRAVIDKLTPEDFWSNQHREIFHAIKETHDSGLVPDVAALRPLLQDNSRGALADILASVPATVNFASLIEHVRNLSDKRRLAAELERSLSRLNEPGTTADSLIVDLMTASPKRRPDSGFMTGEELLSMEFDPLRWLIPGVLPEGITIISAPPKTGKSFFALDIGVSLSLGGAVLGRHVDQVRTMYAALEDSKQRLYNRINKQTALSPLPPLKDFDIATADALATGTEGLQQLRNYTADKKPGLIILDTFGRFWPARDNNDYTETTAIIAAIKRFYEDTRTSILLIHHDRKNATDGDFLQRAVGSIGITGGADTIMMLSRKRAQYDGILQIAARDGEEQELGVRFEPETCRWTIIGTAAEVTDSRQRAAVIQVLKDAEEPLGPNEIAQVIGKKPGAVKMLLGHMVKDGQIIKPYRGKYMALTNNNTDLPYNTDFNDLPYFNEG